MRNWLVLLLIIITGALTGCTGAPASQPSGAANDLEKTPMNTSPSQKPLNIAHRGARSLAPENTMAAARKAFELGADMWELDVAVSGDGELVILHDDTLERTSNAQEVFPNRRPWAVHMFTMEELRQLDFGSWYNRADPFKQIAAGAVTAEMQQSYVGEPIPTLREALTYTRDNQWKVNIEIKDASNTPGDRDVVEKVTALVEELGMIDSVIISSFNHEYLKRVKAANPQIDTAALVSAAKADPIGLVRGLNAQGYNPSIRDILPTDIPAIREAGVDVYVWTVNDADIMRALVRNNATGVITDFPQVMNEVLAETK